MALAQPASNMGRHGIGPQVSLDPLIRCWFKLPSNSWTCFYFDKVIGFVSISKWIELWLMSPACPNPMGAACFYTYKGPAQRRLAATQVSISRSDWVLTCNVAASSNGNTRLLSLPPSAVSILVCAKPLSPKAVSQSSPIHANCLIADIPAVSFIFELRQMQIQIHNRKSSNINCENFTGPIHTNWQLQVNTVCGKWKDKCILNYLHLKRGWQWYSSLCTKGDLSILIISNFHWTPCAVHCAARSKKIQKDALWADKCVNKCVTLQNAESWTVLHCVFNVTLHSWLITPFVLFCQIYDT